MDNYYVYGLGNALVDKEFEVTDSFLTEKHIEKGLMSLIDAKQSEILLQQLTAAYPIKKQAGGGSCANSLYALCQFGGTAFLACRVGDDEGGRFYCNDLKKAGVDSRVQELELSGETGNCLVMVTPDAERTMNTYLGVTADFSERELFLDELLKADWLYIEGYLVTGENARAAILKAKSAAKNANKKIAMTFSDPAIVKYFQAGVDEVLAGEPIDLLFCNHEEACLYTGETDLDKAATKLLQVASQVAVTRGAEGASVYTGAEKISVLSPVVEAVDSNGAGDMFAGAYLYALSENWPVEKAARFACAAAAEVVQNFGPRISQQSQQDLLNKFKS
ncbi:adenosine kinase [Gayadomonas joobiniege]|uniref:adenosine kinase n=1 Tax=Gayadomonas joobiniege TaxID=1234606 RepID=UPI0003640E29|nr:adenosine kinase [Gayadomonas joobiniege]